MKTETQIWQNWEYHQDELAWRERLRLGRIGVV
jgi:hypothetical protein